LVYKKRQNQVNFQTSQRQNGLFLPDIEKSDEVEQQRVEGQMVPRKSQFWTGATPEVFNSCLSHQSQQIRAIVKVTVYLGILCTRIESLADSSTLVSVNNSPDFPFKLLFQITIKVPIITISLRMSHDQQ